MRELFFKPASLRNPAFLDGLVRYSQFIKRTKSFTDCFRGMTEQGSQLWDSSFVPDVRNHLFESSPGRSSKSMHYVKAKN